MSKVHRSLLAGSAFFGRSPRNILKQTAISASLVIGLAGVHWLAAASFAPPAAIAYSSRASISLVRQGEETYQTFLRRAEAIARAATQRRFDSDILVTDVAVTIIGENNGAVLPVMVLKVSRNDWRKQPDPQRWAKYFRNAPLLLGFEPEQEEESEEPPAPPEPTLPEEVLGEDETEPLPTVPPEGEPPAPEPGIEEEESSEPPAPPPLQPLSPR